MMSTVSAEHANPVIQLQHSVEIFSGEGLLFLTEKNEYRLLRGKLLERIAELVMTQRYSRDALVDKLADEFPAAQIYYALFQLEQKGLLITETIALEEE